MALAIVERKTGLEGTAVELENGKMQVIFEDNSKEVAASTFKRWYKVTGEIENNEVATGSEETPAEPKQTVEETMAAVEATFAPEVQAGAKELTRKPATPVAKQEATENKPVEEKQAAPARRGRRSTKQEFLPLTDEQVAEIFNFEAEPAVKVVERICDITNGKEIENVNIDTIEIFGVDFIVRYQDVWTTSVIVMKDKKVIYDSPKASLKDTFNYFGFSDDMQRELKSKIKLARKSAQSDASVYWTKRAQEYYLDMGYEEEFFGDLDLIITEYKNLNRGGRS